MAAGTILFPDSFGESRRSEGFRLPCKIVGSMRRIVALCERRGRWDAVNSATLSHRLFSKGKSRHRRIVHIARTARCLPVPGISERAFLEELAAHGVVTGDHRYWP